jgi:hypothetical protein
MVLKDKLLSTVASPRAIAGQQQEKDVAFYLRRAYKDNDQVFVINDFSFSYNNERAQIDHLIIYPYGFILIESKSIKGEVSINKNEEWSRTIGNKWAGMPSPIKQVELQQKLLKEYLHEYRGEILPKLFGVKLQSFDFRCWHNICAVSSDSILNRDAMTKDISNQIVKSEFVADKVKELMKLKGVVLHTLTLDTRPSFSANDLRAIGSFLLGLSDPKPVTQEIPKIVDTPVKPASTAQLQCKKCSATEELIPKYGRYGYYVNCKKCDANTTMKMQCPQCQSKSTKVSKLKDVYTLSCEICGARNTIFKEKS